MKKKIFKVALAAVIMGVGFFVWQSQRSESLSDLALANIEALASGETTKTYAIREEHTVEIANPDGSYSYKTEVNCIGDGTIVCP